MKLDLVTIVFFSKMAISLVLYKSALPKTKEQLKEKNRKLRSELDTVRRQYQENVYNVVENLKQHCDQTKQNLTPDYETLKHLIKSSTSNEVLEGCRAPEHKHSIKNKGIYCCK